MITPFSSAGEIYAEALANFKVKKYDVAVVYFERAWRKNPGVGEFMELAYCHMNGFGTPKNAARCFAITKVVAERGNAVAQNNLGYLYYNGIGVDKNTNEGILWFESAAAKGHDDAKYTLAKIYHDKSSCKPEYAAKCREYIKALAAKNYKDSSSLLRQWNSALSADEEKGMSTVDVYNRGCDWMNGSGGYPIDYEEAIRWFACAAARDYANAYTNMGWCLDQLHRNKEACDAYFRGANLGAITCMRNLANNIHAGSGWPKDDVAVKAYLRMAHSHGDSKALEKLYQWYPDERSADVIKQHLDRAEAGDVESMKLVALAYRDVKDDENAFDWAVKANRHISDANIKAIIANEFFKHVVSLPDTDWDSKMDYAPTLVGLYADCDALGGISDVSVTEQMAITFRMVTDNYDRFYEHWNEMKPYEWYVERGRYYQRLAADAGSMLAMFSLGIDYMDEERYAEAIKCFEACADTYSEAYLYLAKIYSRKDSGCKDEDKAIRYYHKCIDSDLSDGLKGECYALMASIYLLGERVDTNKVVEYSRKGLALGNTDCKALFALMKLHGNGGVVADRALAIKMYREARNAGSNYAYNLRKMFGDDD
ncbi:MAG: hypothetical protein ACI4A8_08975 [Muribaculaceae bacterium]